MLSANQLLHVLSLKVYSDLNDSCIYSRHVTYVHAQYTDLQTDKDSNMVSFLYISQYKYPDFSLISYTCSVNFGVHYLLVFDHN